MNNILLIVLDRSYKNNKDTIYNVGVIGYKNGILKYTEFETNRNKFISVLNDNRYFLCNFTISSDNKIILKDTNMTVSEKIINAVECTRNCMVESYGTEDSLKGHSVEATSIIIKLLQLYNVKANRKDGWCTCVKEREVYESSHTWVELYNGVYIDVTADQFNYDLKDNKFKQIIIQRELPEHISYNKSKMNQY